MTGLNPIKKTNPPERKIQVLFYGNRGNLPFRIATYLKRRGLEVKLILLPEDLINNRSMPEWESASYNGNYPDWIEKYNGSSFGKSLTQFLPAAIFPPADIKKEAEKYDIVFTSGFHVISALAFDAPVVFYSSGGDLTQLPFRSETKNMLQSLLYRRRLSRVAVILAAQEDILWAAKFLGVFDKVKLYPMPVDLEQIRGSVDRQFLAKLEKKYAEYSHVFLNLSRKNLDPNTPDYKGSDKFIHAFKELTKKYRNLNLRLVLGMHGKHVREFKKLVDDLELNDYCDYEEHLPLYQLHAYLSLSNGIVFDQFGSRPKDVGGVGRETLVMGNVLVSNTVVNDPLFKSFYGEEEAPLLYAYTTDEIFDQMERIIRMDAARLNEIRDHSKKWADKVLHWENRIDELIEILHGAVRHRKKPIEA